MRVTMSLRVWCSHESGCMAAFEAQVPVKPLGLFLMGQLELAGAINVQPPEGWYLEGVERALCPDHNPMLVTASSPLTLPAEISESARGDEEPTPEVLALAEKLQNLAMDRGTTEQERSAAWDRFGELWKRYNLPDELGLQ